MGTYYSLGLIKNFKARSEVSFSESDWLHNLDQRLDVSLFNLTFDADGKDIHGVLKEGVFENNILDFHSKLMEITCRQIHNDYCKEYGTNIDKYYSDTTRIFLCFEKNKEIIIFEACCISLFTEGKVLAEEFNIEPILINWLFRHSNFGNCLSGCVLSCILG